MRLAVAPVSAVCAPPALCMAGRMLLLLLLLLLLSLMGTS
jgi:hypothetical protein